MNVPTGNLLVWCCMMEMNHSFILYANSVMSHFHSLSHPSSSTFSLLYFYVSDNFFSMLYTLKYLGNHLLTTILSLASNEYDFGTISVDGNKWSRTWNLKMRRKVNEKLKKIIEWLRRFSSCSMEEKARHFATWIVNCHSTRAVRWR